MNDYHDTLLELANATGEILSRFHRARDGIHIADGDQARITGIVLEATELLSEALGPLNAFGRQLHSERLEGTNNFYGRQSYHSVEQIGAILRAAAKTVERRNGTRIVNSTPMASYVDSERLSALRAIGSEVWDLRRLIRMCEELNSSFTGGNYHATAMLLRAITDHIPPIFKTSTFATFASSVASNSLKASMERLSKSLRDIADGALHIQIRNREVLPTSTQVDFRQELDLLLGEVIRAMADERK